ncbi:hypothetical protein BDR22DRAFT_817169 [Usnea florida]
MNSLTGSSPHNAELTMGNDYYWAKYDSAGRLEAKSLNLTSPKPITRTTPQSGDRLYMIQSGSTYYIWNKIEGDVWQITGPTDLREIFSTMTNNGMAKLVFKLVD